MFGTTLRQHFQVMGADVRVALDADRFEIDIVNEGGHEVFDLRLPSDGRVTAKVLDADRKRKHLLLDVNHRGYGMNQKYLCGHDEFHWFVAALPDKRGITTLPEAMEALKPELVKSEQRQKRVKRKRRRGRRTTAYVRQGEWFFIPRPKLDVDEDRVEHNGALVRGEGKPHHVQWLCHTTDGKATYVRGRVAHPDHTTLHLETWHQVLRNMEIVPKELPVTVEREEVFHMNYLD